MCIDFDTNHLKIPRYADLVVDNLGMDSYDRCFDKKHFKNYETVTYRFNQLGFRTHCHTTFQKNAVLVLGDSFTLGLGVNVANRYTDMIEQKLNHQVLNFSLNGGSNDWIARKLEQLLCWFDPKAIVIHYTFSHRREKNKANWFDDERTECEPLYSCKQNFDNWYQNFHSIKELAAGLKLFHSFIPHWHDQDLDYNTFGSNLMAPIRQIDLARDGFHYGHKTHQLLASALTNLLGDV